MTSLIQALSQAFVTDAETESLVIIAILSGVGLLLGSIAEADYSDDVRRHLRQIEAQFWQVFKSSLLELIGRPFGLQVPLKTASSKPRATRPTGGPNDAGNIALVRFNQKRPRGRRTARDRHSPATHKAAISVADSQDMIPSLRYVVA